MAKFGLELYTVRALMEEDPADTLQAVARIGYCGVEFPKLWNLDAKQTRRSLDDNGLTAICVNVNEEWENPHRVIDFALTVGARYTGLIWAKPETRQDFIDLASRLEELGKLAKTNGLGFVYHNHGHELEQFDGEYGLDILYDHCDPQYVQAELDTCFLHAKGVPVAEYIRKYTGRLPLLHLKDWEPGARNGTIEIGRGVLDVRAAIAAGLDAKAEWIIAEQEVFSIYPPIESAKFSYDYVKSLDMGL